MYFVLIVTKRMIAQVTGAGMWGLYFIARDICKLPDFYTGRCLFGGLLVSSYVVCSITPDVLPPSSESQYESLAL